MSIGVEANPEKGWERVASGCSVRKQTSEAKPVSHRRSGTFLAAFLLASAFAIPANAATFDFAFTAQCDDCAFTGDPSDPDFDPIDDGLFETVSGTLRLTDVSLNIDGFIEVDSNNFWLFTDSCGSFFTFFGLKRGKHGGENLESEILLVA